MISIINIAGYVGAGTTITALLYGVFSFVDNNKRQDKEIRKMKDEQKIIVSALRGTLDGLHQLGCNGRVTESISALDEHLNNAAHED